jgi:hypothetical protein
MWRRLAQWWGGTRIENPPGTTVFVVGRTFHWTAIWAHAIVDYVRKHHRWIIGLSVSAALAILTKMK